MRHNSKVRAIAGFQEESHTRRQSEHGCFTLWVGETDGDQKGARDHGEEVHPELLRPHGVGMTVDDVRDEAPEWARDDVQEAEHRRPATRLGLAETGEVRGVEGSQRAVEGQLGAEAARIVDGQRHGRQAQGDLQGFSPGGCHDYFFLDCHLTSPGTVVYLRFGVGGTLLDLLVNVVNGSCRHGGCESGGQSVRFFMILDDAVEGCRAGWRINAVEVSVGPFTSRGIFAGEQHAQGDSGDDDEGYNICHPPRLVR